MEYLPKTQGSKRLYNFDVNMTQACTLRCTYCIQDFNKQKFEKLSPELTKKIIEKFDMKSFQHQKIENLSTGQYQRTSIARCLVHNPKYYILDEATSGLDIISSQVILDFIKEERKKNKCIIYSTHYMEEAENLCDKIIMINNGKIIATGSPKEIKKKTKDTNLRDSFFNLIGGNNEQK